MTTPSPFDFSDKPIARAAYNLAHHWHEGQSRKYTGEPYLTHPVAVTVLLLANKEYDQELLATAMLHDVLEDTACPKTVILNHCGDRVLRFVEALTKPSGMSRDRREEVYLDQLMRANPIAQKVKLADIAHNLSDLVKNDPDYAPTYLEKKQRQIDALRHPEWSIWHVASETASNALNDLALLTLAEETSLENQRIIEEEELTDIIAHEIANDYENCALF